MEVIGLDLLGHFDPFDLDLSEIRLVRAINRPVYELESPHLHQVCILGLSAVVLKMRVIDLGF